MVNVLAVEVVLIHIDPKLAKSEEVNIGFAATIPEQATELVSVPLTKATPALP